jgi:hypothetical protein
VVVHVDVLRSETHNAGYKSSTTDSASELLKAQLPLLLGSAQ